MDIIGEIPVWVLEHGQLKTKPLVNIVSDGSYIYYQPDNTVVKECITPQTDISDIVGAMVREIDIIGRVFEPHDDTARTELTDALGDYFHTKVAFATPDAFARKWKSANVKKDPEDANELTINSDIPGAYFSITEGTIIPLIAAQKTSTYLHYFKHEFGGHQMDDERGSFRQRTITMKELAAILVQEKLGDTRTYPKNPHKRAYELLTRMRNETLFGALEFTEQWRALQSITEHSTAMDTLHNYFVKYRTEKANNLTQRLLQYSQDTPHLLLPLNVQADNSALRNSESKYNIAEINFENNDTKKGKKKIRLPQELNTEIGRLAVQAHARDLSCESLDLLVEGIPLPENIDEIQTSLIAYRMKCMLEISQKALRRQSITALLREIPSDIEVDDIDLFLDKTMKPPEKRGRSNAWMVLESMTSYQSAELYITRTLNQASEEYYVCVVSPAIVTDSLKSSKYQRGQKVASQKPSIIGEGYFWFDKQGQLHCRVYGNTAQFNGARGWKGVHYPTNVYDTNPTVHTAPRKYTPKNQETIDTINNYQTKKEVSRFLSRLGNL